jgi:hypothetical protein
VIQVFNRIKLIVAAAFVVGSVVGGTVAVTAVPAQAAQTGCHVHHDMRCW